MAAADYGLASFAEAIRQGNYLTLEKYSYKKPDSIRARSKSFNLSSELDTSYEFWPGSLEANDFGFDRDNLG